MHRNVNGISFSCLTGYILESHLHTLFSFILFQALILMSNAHRVCNFCFLQLNGCMSYYDKVPDGFYLIHGMDPYLWTISTDLQESGRIPSFDLLKAVDPCDDSQIEVVLVDKSWDPDLMELQNRVLSLYSYGMTREDVVNHLAELVCNHMGYIFSLPLAFEYLD